MATWTLDGELINLLNSCFFIEHFAGTGYDDVTSIMDLFARVRAEKACFHMPRGLKPGETTDCIRGYLRSTNAMMTGRISIDGDVYSEEDEKEAKEQDDLDEECEERLHFKGAKIRNMLDMLDARVRLCRLYS